jgi:hypothetical protein
MSQQTSTSETIVALYLALKLRDSCESCNGSGMNWVGIGNGTEVDAEPCQCSEIAWYVLGHYEDKFITNSIIYLAERGIVPDGKNTLTLPDLLMNELFKNVR